MELWFRVELWFRLLFAFASGFIATLVVIAARETHLRRVERRAREDAVRILSLLMKASEAADARGREYLRTPLFTGKADDKKETER